MSDPAARDTLICHEVRTMDSLKALRAPWERVWQRSSSKFPSTTWEWAASWWKHFGAARELQVLEIVKAGEAVGFVPVVIERRGIFLPTTCRPAMGLFDYQDFLSAAGHEQTVVHEAAKFLASNGSWDVLELTSLPWRGAPVETCREAFSREGHQVLLAPGKPAWILKLDAAWEELLKKLNDSWRETVRYEIRRLEKKGARYSQAETEKDCLRLIQEAYRLRNSSAELEVSEEALARNPHLLFHLELAPSLFQKRLLKIWSLTVEGSAIAVLYAFSCSNNLIDYLTAYHRAWRTYSPGTVLTAYWIREAIATGMSELNFGSGDERYKRHWCSAPSPTQDILVVSKRPKARLRAFNARVLKRLRRYL